jgi:hypothetical protein
MSRASLPGQARAVQNSATMSTGKLLATHRSPTSVVHSWYPLNLIEEE